MNIFKKLYHKLEHLCQTNTGRVISWHDKDYVYISFKCDTCDEIILPPTVILVASSFFNNPKDENYDTPDSTTN